MTLSCIISLIDGGDVSRTFLKVLFGIALVCTGCAQDQVMGEPGEPGETVTDASMDLGPAVPEDILPERMDTGLDVLSDTLADLPQEDLAQDTGQDDLPPDSAPDPEDTAPEPSPEVCGDMVDNDLDGETDEGCAPVVGTWVGDFAFVARFGAGGALYRIRADGRERQELVPGPEDGHYQDLDWSPDGQWIAFVHSTRSELQIQQRIHRVRPDGSDLTFMAEGSSPVFSPQSDSVLMVSTDLDVVRVDLDGNVLNNYGAGEGADWFPDGQQVVVTRSADQPQLQIVNTDGSNPRTLVAPAQGARLGKVSFDADWVAFLQGRGNTGRVHVVDVDGNNDRILPPLTPGVSHTDPAWHPSALKLAYSTGQLPETSGIGDPFGGDPFTIGRGRKPQWTPDGSSLLLQFDSAIVWSDAGSEDQHFVVTGTDPVWNPLEAEALPLEDDLPCKFEQTFNDLGLHRENSFTGNRWFAFRYEAEQDAQISRVGFFTGEQAGTTRIELRAHDADTDSPSAQVLAETTYDQEGFVGWQDGDFDIPVVVLAGQTYWVVARFPNGSQTMFAIQGDTFVQYKGGDSREGPWDGPYQNYAMIRFNLCF